MAQWRRQIARAGFDIGRHKAAWEYQSFGWKESRKMEIVMAREARRHRCEGDDFGASGDLHRSLVVKQFITYYRGNCR